MAAAPLVGSTLLEGKLFCVPISTCFGAGLRGGPEKTWLLEFLHDLPPGSSSAIYPRFQSPTDLSLLSASAQVVCSAWKGFPSTTRQLLLIFPSSYQMSPPPGSLSCDPHLGHMTPPLCSPILLGFHHSTSVVVVCNCYSFLCFSVFPTRLGVP